MTNPERQQIGVIEHALRTRRLSFDDRLNLADKLGIIARPIHVVRPESSGEEESA
jgi:hypothetical protein